MSGTPDFTVGETGGTPDVTVDDVDLLTLQEARAIFARLGHASDVAAATAADPLGMGMPVTAWPRERAANVSVSANQARFMRVVGGGRISKIALHASTQSGNISVAVYRNTGVGDAAAPGQRIATSGAIACPNGYAAINIAPVVDVAHGDWFCLTADNGTAAFYAGNASIATSDLGKGFSYFANSAHPAPSPAPALTAMVGDAFILKGIP